MSNLLLSIRKALNKVIVGTSRIFYGFDKSIEGVKKSKIVNVPNYEKDTNFQIFYPANFNDKKLPTIFYFHGGGWIEYDKSLYNTLCKRLAKMGNIVVNIDYPLAPKYKMQELLEGCINIINNAENIAKENYNANGNIILAGDSAGAQISALLGGAQSAGKFNELFPNLTIPNVTELLLFYGVYDFETVEKTDFPSIKLMLDAVFTSELDLEYHKYSPINYVTKNFPRSFIASGEVDKLHILQTLEFVKTLDKENVPYQAIYFDKGQMFGLHGFIAFDDFVTNKETRKAIENFLSKNIELSK